MFDSGIKASDLIAQIKDEADIAIPISDENYISWLNALEQLLYSEIIQEQKKYTFNKYSPVYASPLNLYPVLEAQTINDVVMTVVSPGTYKFTPTSVMLGTSSKGARIACTITLPAGWYTLSDNATFPLSATASFGTIHVYSYKYGSVIHTVSSKPGNTSSVQFSLAEQTKLGLYIDIPANTSFPSGGYIISPQLEAGMVRHDFVQPLDSYEEMPLLRCDFPEHEGEADLRFEDVYALYADRTQLIKSTPTSGVIFPHTYYKDDNYLGMNVSEFPDKFTVVYIVRPALKTDENISTAHVMLPAEFIDLAKAKLRGEAYKLANEYELSAMWLNDYNVLLEGFKQWLSGKQPKFGM